MRLASPPAPLRLQAAPKNMKKAIVAFLLLTALITGVLLYLALSKPAPKADSLLPESTLVFLDIPDFSKSRADFANTDLYALWREPEVQAFLEQPLSVLCEAYGANAPDTANIGNFLLNTVQGEVFLALTHVTMFPTLNLGLVLGADVHHKRIEALAALHQLEKRLKQTYPDGSFQDKKYLGVRYTVWETEPGFPVCHAFFNSLVVFTLGEDTMRDAITCFAGQVPPDFKRLTDSAKFQNIERHASRDHGFLAYLNVEEALNLIGPLMALAPQTGNMYQSLQQIQASAVSMTFVDRGVEDVGFLAYSGSQHKPTPPTQRKTLAVTAPDTLFYSVGSVDLPTLYEEGMGLLSQSGSPPLMTAAGDFQLALRNRGIHIREDVLKKVGPELAIVANWRPGARAPDAAVVAEITDADNLRPALDNAMNALKASVAGNDEQYPWDETESSGQKLRTVRVGAGLFAPTYTTTGQFFILASTPDYARELLGQAKDSKPTLTASTTYQQSMKRLSTNGSSYGYADLRGIFEPLYSMARRGASQIGSNAFFDTGKLPRTETISRHLFPYVSTTVSEPQQVTSTSFSPFGKSFGLIAGVGSAFWVVDTFRPELAATGNYVPIAAKKSSSRAVPSMPRENQTAASQTPATP